MAEIIEGDWKNFTFKLATEDDFEKVNEHLRISFFPDEPLNLLFKTPNEFSEELEPFVREFIKDGLSFFAFEKKTGKIAGARITHHSKKGEKNSELENVTFKTNVAKIIKLLDYQQDNANLYERFGVNEYADFFMTSTDPEFRGQGLVTEMYKRSLLLIKAKNIPICKSSFTSPFTRKAAINLGFEGVISTVVKDFKDENGEELFPMADPDFTVHLMIKKLL